MGYAQWKVGVLKRLPKNAISRAFGAISEVEFPAPLQRAVNRSFAGMVGVDTDEAEHPPGHYSTLNGYFTRRLREGARPIDEQGETTAVSPVDGRLGAHGRIEEGTLFQAKGRRYKLLELVDSAADAQWFAGGWYATIYLSPRDYHRIHSPVAGTVQKVSYIPGHLFPVNPFAVDHIDDLFAVNERLITYLDTEEFGAVAVIKVGATCVGRIGLSYEPLETNGPLRRRREFAPRESIDVAHGEELGVFNLGSTVILLFQEPAMAFRDDLKGGEMLRMGEGLAEIVSNSK